MRNYRCGQQLAVSKRYAGAAVCDIKPKRNSIGIELPEAKRAGSRLYTIAVQRAVAARHEIPGQDSFGDHAAPAQIAIAAFPCVAHYKQALRNLQ